MFIPDTSQLSMDNTLPLLSLYRSCHMSLYALSRDLIYWSLMEQSLSRGL